MRLLGLRGCVALALWLGLLAPSAQALDPTSATSQYGHNAWRLRDGDLPASPYPIAQTTDGYLWIGTQLGVVRFDGVRFVRLSELSAEPLPSNFVTALKGTRDGSLWIGTTQGLSRWSNHQLTRITTEQVNITAMLEDRQGAFWYAKARNRDMGATPIQLCRVEGATSHCYGDADGLKVGPEDQSIGAIAQEADGTLIMSTDMSVVRWKPGEQSQVINDEAKSKAGVPGRLVLAQTPAGAVYVGVDAPGPGLGLQQLQGTAFNSLTSPLDGSAFAAQAVFVDRHGVLWVGTLDQGIYRMQGDQVDHFRATDGLSSDCIYWFFEDREGNVWVSTSEGVDRFRDLSVKTFTKREGMRVDEADSVVARRNGDVLVGGADGFSVLRQGKISYITTAEGLPGHQITSMFEDHAGVLWLGVEKSLGTYENGHFNEVFGVDGAPAGMVYALMEDGEHDIWARIPKKIVRIRDHKVVEVVDSGPAAAAVDLKSGIWLGRPDGEVVHIDHGATKSYQFDRKWTRVRDMVVTPDGAVIGATDTGLIGLKNGVLRSASSDTGFPCDALYRLVVDSKGNLWVHGECGLLKLTPADLAQWWQTPDARLSPRMVTALDGFRSGQPAFSRGAVQAVDGRLWLVNGVGVQALDPERIDATASKLTVNIEEVMADRKSFGVRPLVVLPPNPSMVRFSYSAPSFSTPQRLQFRYRLEGKDPAWIEAGPRRQAFYNDLPPGDYRFFVSARHGDGPWVEGDAPVTLRVTAAWYQTTWFRLLCVLAGLAAIVAIYRWRIRAVAGELKARFDERLEERTRLAREIHDTLLQTMQGSKMVADNALEESGDSGRLRHEMQRLSAWLGDAIGESREAIQQLRTSSTQGNDLAASLKRATEECRVLGGLDVAFTVQGPVRDMHPIVRDEVYRIGYEAIRNACVHSKGTRLDVVLGYSQQLALTVRDDGHGMSEDDLAGKKVGHFGLQGMRERAARIGGKLTITSTSAGTEVSLTVPGTAIFRDERDAGFFAKWRGEPE